MVRVLERAGYETIETDNGHKALDLIPRKRVDILLTDLRLPVMDGVELLKRAKAASPGIEVILVTGYGTIETAVEALKLGACDFLTKPVKKADLVRAVEPSRSAPRGVSCNGRQ
jgi:two-component system response regulator HydG